MYVYIISSCRRWYLKILASIGTLADWYMWKSVLNFSLGEVLRFADSFSSAMDSGLHCLLAGDQQMLDQLLTYFLSI